MIVLFLSYFSLRPFFSTFSSFIVAGKTLHVVPLKWMCIKAQSTETSRRKKAIPHWIMVAGPLFLSDIIPGSPSREFVDTKSLRILLHRFVHLKLCLLFHMKNQFCRRLNLTSIEKKFSFLKSFTYHKNLGVVTC